MWFLEKLLAQSRCSVSLFLTHFRASGVSPCFPHGPLCHLACSSTLKSMPQTYINENTLPIHGMKLGPVDGVRGHRK